MEYSKQSFTPTYGKFPTPVGELNIGDVFWHSVRIEREDIANSTSDTAKDVRNNRCTRRLVVVVCTSPLLVLYLATFNKVTRLPRTLRDRSVWYPVDDAEPANSISLPPLETEPRQGFAQWVNMRKLHTVNVESVLRIGGFHFSEQAVNNIMVAMMNRFKAKLEQTACKPAVRL